MKKNKKIILFCIFVMLSLVIISLLLIKEKQNDNEKIDLYDKYIYKIRYDFGSEGYIYLLDNNIVKYVGISEVYDVMEDCNCLKPTGEYEYDEQTINFSKKNIEKVINVLDDLYKQTKKKEFNIDNIKLSKYQEKVLLSIVLNDEDKLNVDDNY